MRTTNVVSKVLALGIAVVAGAACSGDPAAPETGAATSLPSAREDVVDGWTLEVSRIATAPALVAPAARLPADAFDPDHAAETLLGERRALVPVKQVRSRTRFESESFSIEVDPAKGTLLALRREPSRRAGNAAEAELQTDARARLRGFGIPDDEVASVVTRKLLAQDDARGDKPSAPRLVAYKTFVTRGLGGVEVAGHRAVVTHDLDGTLRKVLVSWPALAPTGHRLRTPMSFVDIEQTAAARLTSLGKTRDHASLAWTLEPSAASNGATQLTLRVAAALPAVDHGDIVDEPEVELVDIGATE